jgi:hypothetical protein
MASWEQAAINILLEIRTYAMDKSFVKLVCGEKVYLFFQDIVFSFLMVPLKYHQKILINYIARNCPSGNFS